MEKFSKFEISIDTAIQTNQYGKYIISPLEKGFGNTLGNALRRVMLSSVPGSAAFAIRIPGVSHEFQAISGVKEDVTEIILNVKNLVIKIDESIYSDHELETSSLEKWPIIKSSKTSGTITGADLECPAGMSIVNKDLHIATLEGKSKFELQIFATRSRGFKTFQENKEKINTGGIIAIDSNFSPVIRVAYNVEETKTAKRGTSDKLVMELSTNGSLSPSDTIALAAKILSAHLDPVIAINDRIKELEVMKEREVEEKVSALSIPIEDLGITMRSYNGLKRHGIQTIHELTNKTRDEINKIRNLGKKSIKEINAKLAERGLKFKD